MPKEEKKSCLVCRGRGYRHRGSRGARKTCRYCRGTGEVTKNTFFVRIETLGQRQDREELDHWRKVAEDALGYLTPTPEELLLAIQWRNRVAERFSDLQFILPNRYAKYFKIEGDAK